MIYFDNAATTLYKPDCVVQAVVEAMGTLGNAGRGAHSSALGTSRVVYEARAELAKLFGAESPECIAFTANATQSLNIALKGTLKSGDHVITTALEHNSVLRPLYELEQMGVEVTILPADQKGNICYEEFEKSIKSNTKVIVTTNASNLTGNVLDVGRIGKIAKEVGKLASERDILYIVDASQTAGVFDINVQDMNIDILCFTGHKGLLGPQGTGGIYVKPGTEVRPLLVGGSGVQTYLKTHPAQMPTALEAGTLNGHGIAGLGAAIKYLSEYGLKNIREKEQELMWDFYSQVSQIPGITVYGDFADKNRSGIVSLNVRDYDSGQVSDVLASEFGIATRPGAHCAPLMHEALGTVSQGAVRFSFSHNNTKEEIDIAVNALKELAQEE